MVRLTTLILSLACSALASPFSKHHGKGHPGHRKVPSFANVSITTRDDVGGALFDRAKPTFICDATCKACVAKIPKKGKGKSPRSLAEDNLALHERTLDDIEDLWGGPGETNDYVIKQITEVAGAGDELDWSLLQHDAVSGQGPWKGKDMRKYIQGIMG